MHAHVRDRGESVCVSRESVKMLKGVLKEVCFLFLMIWWSAPKNPKSNLKSENLHILVPQFAFAKTRGCEGFGASVASM